MFTKFNYIKPTKLNTLQFKYTFSKFHYGCSYLYCIIFSTLDTHSERSSEQKHLFAIVSQINLVLVEYNNPRGCVIHSPLATSSVNKSHNPSLPQNNLYISDNILKACMKLTMNNAKKHRLRLGFLWEDSCSSPPTIHPVDMTHEFYPHYLRIKVIK